LACGVEDAADQYELVRYIVRGPNSAADDPFSDPENPAPAYNSGTERPLNHTESAGESPGAPSSRSSSTPPVNVPRSWYWTGAFEPFARNDPLPDTACPDCWIVQSRPPAESVPLYVPATT